ncbi:unnamed protein product [Candidula unifasciata]|uniref:Cilia- and flagella-associated protein 126 n=1 Tax=Candidula unifasciata TaxID=100452 RepID=A0A8S3ZBG8_9EUPU|nr:unnamed protein product [Candidula unifasciata]
MSINFHANQYEQAFAPHRLQNWEVPKQEEGIRPKAHTGFTRITANERGHLLPNVPKDRSSPWGKFVGTWDMPKKIPGTRVLNPTARSEEAYLKNKEDKEKSDVVLSGALKQRHTVDPLPVKMDAPEDQRPAGIICEPIGGSAGQPTCEMPCPQVETVHYDANQPRALSRKESRESLKWPKAKTPDCRSPVNYSPLPKPMTTFYANSPGIQGDHQHCRTAVPEN